MENILIIFHVLVGILCWGWINQQVYWNDGEKGNRIPLKIATLFVFAAAGFGSVLISVLFWLVMRSSADNPYKFSWRLRFR